MKKFLFILCSISFLFLSCAKTTAPEETPQTYRPSTSIHYRLTTEGNVKIFIENYNHDLVKILVDEEKPAGNHTTTWDGKNSNNENVPSGIYYMFMETNTSQYKRVYYLAK